MLERHELTVFVLVIWEVKVPEVARSHYNCISRQEVRVASEPLHGRELCCHRNTASNSFDVVVALLVNELLEVGPNAVKFNDSRLNPLNLLVDPLNRVRHFLKLCDPLSHLVGKMGAFVQALLQVLHMGCHLGEPRHQLVEGLDPGIDCVLEPLQRHCHVFHLGVDLLNKFVADYLLLVNRSLYLGLQVRVESVELSLNLAHLVLQAQNVSLLGDVVLVQPLAPFLQALVEVLVLLVQDFDQLVRLLVQKFDAMFLLHVDARHFLLHVTNLLFHGFQTFLCSFELVLHDFSELYGCHLDALLELALQEVRSLGHDRNLAFE